MTACVYKHIENQCGFSSQPTLHFSWGAEATDAIAVTRPKNDFYVNLRGPENKEDRTRLGSFTV